MVILGAVTADPTFALPDAADTSASTISSPRSAEARPMSRPTALVLAAPGTNRDRDVAFALDLAGAESRDHPVRRS